MSGNQIFYITPSISFFFTVSGILCLLVIITNGLIVGVNLADWMKGRSLMPSGKILVSLGLSNLCFSTAITLDYFISHIWKQVYRTFYMVQKITLTLDIAMSFWFTAWLSVFYCMKIVNFKQSFLLKVKLKFSSLVHWFLLGSVLASFGATILVLWAFTKITQGNPTKYLNNQTIVPPSDFNLTNNYKKQKILVHMTLYYRLLIIILGCSVPLVVVIVSSVSVLNFLFRHAQNLEQNASIFHNPCLEVHLNAAKSVLSLVLSYISLFVCEILMRTEIFPNWTYQYFLCLTFQLSTLVAQGFILITSNPKLKQSAVQILPCVQW
ncbi:taste receptor type 2 member 40-like [Rhineura floridana]|uniref:taste receptor type 2 member 40-like n=1 Tax=Rhineura floridana TaxID=261503 RepID=UPI002AC8326B|nr:taste receptor type 2 member 40-like [Rhineura floridana]